MKINAKEIESAIHFYEKCLDKRLSENDFSFAKDGSSGQKLDILESMMLLKQSITMIGDFTDRGPKLYAEKIAGNVCGCIGFVKDKNTFCPLFLPDIGEANRGVQKDNNI